METKIWKYIQKHRMIEPGDHLVVGVSGGADSVCLLVVLCQFSERVPFTMEVVHVNHGLRKEATCEAEYVKALCRERKLVCHSIEADVKVLAREWGIGEEEAGRRLRYEAFDKVCRRAAEVQTGAVKIAVAHHQNDRAETMLFHLFRGTGVAGLCGIKPVRDNVIRPLLCVSREEVENYLKEKNIAYCHDASNDCDDYSRNRIRHHILPQAEALVEHSVEHMNHTAELLEEAWDYITEQSSNIYDNCVIRDEKRIKISIPDLWKEAPVLQKNVLWKAISMIAGSKKDITSAHIDAVWTLCTKDGSCELRLPYEIIAKKEYDILYLQKITLEKKVELEDTMITVPMTVPLPDGMALDFTFVDADMERDGIPQKKYTKWFDYDRIEQSLILRGRKTGDYLTINEAMSKKTLKQYMIDEKIPKDSRDSVPLLADGNHIIWAVGYRISENYKVNKHTKHILQVQLRGGQ